MFRVANENNNNKHMKRRLKLTPFAKLFFAAIVLFAAWYVYKHQDEIKEKKIFNFKDTINFEDSDLESEIQNNSDTVVFYVSNGDTVINLKVNGTVLQISKNVSGFTPDTLYFSISEEKRIIGKLIAE